MDVTRLVGGLETREALWLRSYHNEKEGNSSLGKFHPKQRKLSETANSMSIKTKNKLMIADAWVWLKDQIWL